MLSLEHIYTRRQILKGMSALGSSFITSAITSGCGGGIESTSSPETISPTTWWDFKSACHTEEYDVPPTGYEWKKSPYEGLSVGGDLKDGTYHYLNTQPKAYEDNTAQIAPEAIAALLALNTMGRFDTALPVCPIGLGTPPVGVLVLAAALTHYGANAGIRQGIEGPITVPVQKPGGKIEYKTLIELQNTLRVHINTAGSTKLEGPWPTDFKLQIGGNPFPPDGWKPPDKDPNKNCGVDLVEYFALLLVQETLGGMMSKLTTELLINQGQTPNQIDNQLEEFQKKPIFSEYDSLIQKKQDQLYQQMNDGECYKYPGGGSVFMDYKLLRARAFLKLGGYQSPSSVTKEKYGQLWNKDGAIQTAYMKGVNDLGNKFNPDISTQEALNRAKTIIQEYWFGE